MSPLPKLILVTGPARSGKSEWAENLASAQGKAVTYIATSLQDSQDLEWWQRIQAHRQRRPPAWTTQEVPRDLVGAIASISPPHCLLIDSLGTWVANLLELDDLPWQKTQTDLLHCLQLSPLTLILVAEETAWGVIPAYPSGRVFRDRLGSLIRQIGTLSDTVYLVTAGHVLNLTQLGQPLTLN